MTRLEIIVHTEHQVHSNFIEISSTFLCSGASYAPFIHFPLIVSRSDTHAAFRYLPSS